MLYFLLAGSSPFRFFFYLFTSNKRYETITTQLAYPIEKRREKKIEENKPILKWICKTKIDKIKWKTFCFFLRVLFQIKKCKWFDSILSLDRIGRVGWLALHVVNESNTNLHIFMQKKREHESTNEFIQFQMLPHFCIIFLMINLFAIVWFAIFCFCVNDNPN